MIKLYYTFSETGSEEFIKKALKKHSGKDGLVIKRTQNGKPYTDGEKHFSLSHTQGLTLCAVSDSPIGVDAEKIRKIKNKEKILLRFTNTDAKGIDDTEFLEKWTAFESRVKFFGEKIADCPLTLTKSTYVVTEVLDGYVVSICSQEADIIEKERI